MGCTLSARSCVCNNLRAGCSEPALLSGAGNCRTAAKIPAAVSPVCEVYLNAWVFRQVCGHCRCDKRLIICRSAIKNGTFESSWFCPVVPYCHRVIEGIYDRECRSSFGSDCPGNV